MPATPDATLASEGQEGEDEREQTPPPLSLTGLVYPIYTNDSGFMIAAKQSIMDSWFEFAQEASATHMTEHAASIRIQSSIRQRAARNLHAINRHAQLSLSRVYRGHRGRIQYEEEQRLHLARLRREFWNSTATLVQKIWRGYFSRKNIHNFYLRKAYIATIASKGEAVRQELTQHFEILQAEAQNREVETKVDDFEKVVGSLHHLLSTASCRGVYNSPYHQAAQATMFGIPVEDHLKNVARGTLRQTIGRLKSDTMSQASSSGIREDRIQADDFYAFATKPAKITRVQ